jgi:DNA-binding HxlR family transcriptional regulator
MHDLRQLLGHPNVVEVLDVLSDGPLTLADMKARTAASRRALAVALRVLVAHGLVSASDSGTWDSITRGHRVYRHTDHGAAVVEALSHFATWTTLFEMTEADG